MSHYKVVANMEWTSKCNARCVMCPQQLIHKPQLMQHDTFHKVLARINPNDVYRAVIAGYGEPTTHPLFERFIDDVGDHPVRFDLVSNGQELDERRLRHIDGKVDLMLISFSSIDPEVYSKVHVKLDHERVKRNIQLAQKIFRKTAFGISLTPLPECLDTLPQTIDWLKQQGVQVLTLSPTLYNRGGTLDDHETSTRRLRQLIDDYDLHSQELDFIPSFRDSLAQRWSNRFKCTPRNSDIFITASGEYLYCYNDISHRHTLGDVDQLSIRDALAKREQSRPIEALCNDCNMLGRYRPLELLQVAGKVLGNRVAGMVSG
jgi:MoaA/NifB/PqqE/SkfB family radical SAM enzyme